MSKFDLPTGKLRQGFNAIKLVKPETGDFCLRFFRDYLVLFSYDDRRKAIAKIEYDKSSDLSDQFELDDFYLFVDRVALLDSDAGTTSISLNDKSFTIKVDDGTQSKKAVLKRRSSLSKRPPVPVIPDSTSFHGLDRKEFDEILLQSSCSGLVKETKTEEDMRVNQIHFYADQKCAISNARYYGSIVHSDLIKFDISLVSSDIPIIRGFITKTKSDKIRLNQTTKGTEITDDQGSFYLFLNKINSNKPEFKPFDGEFSHQVKVKQELFVKNLNWASLAIEGTQRITLHVEKDEIHILNGSQDLSSMKSDLVKGSGFKADFPVKFLQSLASFVDGDILLNFGYANHPTVLGITAENSQVRYTHFIQSMRSK